MLLSSHIPDIGNLDFLMALLYEYLVKSASHVATETTVSDKSDRINP